MQHERCEEYTNEDLVIIEREDWCEVCSRTTDHQGEDGPCIRCLSMGRLAKGASAGL